MNGSVEPDVGTCRCTGGCVATGADPWAGVDGGTDVFVGGVFPAGCVGCVGVVEVGVDVVGVGVDVVGVGVVGAGVVAACVGCGPTDCWVDPAGPEYPYAVLPPPSARATGASAAPPTASAATTLAAVRRCCLSLPITTSASGSF